MEQEMIDIITDAIKGLGSTVDRQSKIVTYLVSLIEEKYRTNSKITAQDYREMLEYMAKVEKQNN
jgi:hypothetical protein